MKRFVYIVTLILIMLAVYSQNCSAKSYAMLVGVDKYIYEKQTLPGAVNDVIAMKNLLIGWCGFNSDSKSIATLCGSSATRKATLSGMSTLARTCKSGDTVVIYFSLHGRIVKQDGINKAALILHDSNPSKASTTITRTDFGKLLASIHASHIYVVLDCCFAGDFRHLRTIPRASGESSVVNDASSTGLSDAVIEWFEPVGRGNQMFVYAGEPRKQNREILLSDGRTYVSALVYALYNAFYMNPGQNCAKLTDAMRKTLTDKGIDQQPWYKGLDKLPLFGGVRQGIRAGILPRQNGHNKALGGAILGLKSDQTVTCLDLENAIVRKCRLTKISPLEAKAVPLNKNGR